MAKRLLKDWTASSKIDAVSPEAEVFFTRLIMKADDYGSFHANPKLLKAALFPLRDVTMQQIGAWVFECTAVGLIFPYEVDGKEYIRINDFGQRLRNQRNAFPHPEIKPQQIAAIGGESLPEEKRREEEVEPADAALSVNGKQHVPRGQFAVDSYPSGQKAFEEIQSDDQMVERLVRMVRNEGNLACDEVKVMTAVKRFLMAEEVKPDFTRRPRDEIKKHMVNWIRTKAKSIT